LDISCNSHVFGVAQQGGELASVGIGDFYAGAIFDLPRLNQPLQSASGGGVHASQAAAAAFWFAALFAHVA
jgi:hypothetical protein